MAKSEVRVFSNLESLSWAAVTMFENLARAKAVGKKAFSAALSGGLTPRMVYQILGSPELAGRLGWKNIHLFQVDERCVPPDHPDSNYRMIRQALLDSAEIPHFYRMEAEKPDLDEVARAYTKEIARVLKPDEGALPHFDLVILGMGSDGHTASLFPGTPALDEQTAWVRPNHVQKLGMNRLTMTLPVLNAASQVVFMVAGADKAEIVRRVLEDPQAGLPAQKIQPQEGRLSWFLDEAAARKLSPSTKG
jgi:6-phosphogluconolactonase